MSDSSSNPNNRASGADDGGKLSLLQVLSMLQESNAAANNNSTNNSANAFQIMEVQQRQAQQLTSLLCPPQQPSKVQQGGLPSNSNAESLPTPPSPSVEDGSGKLLLLQSEIDKLQSIVGCLQSRVSSLEAENTILKQRIHTLRKIESDKATE